ncbi:hypothetical protein Tco_0073012 [Tanacetum coccineum]
MVRRRLTDGRGIVFTPRGTTQVVTRGHLMIVCQIVQVAGTRYEVLYTSVPGTVHVSTRYCSGGGWTNQMVTRGTDVCQSETDSIFDEFSLPRPPEESNSEYSDANNIEYSISIVLSPLRIVTLLWRRSTYFLLPMTRCHQGIEIVDYYSEGDIRFLEEFA